MHHKLIEAKQHLVPGKKHNLCTSALFYFYMWVNVLRFRNGGKSNFSYTHCDEIMKIFWEYIWQILSPIFFRNSKDVYWNEHWYFRDRNQIFFIKANSCTIIARCRTQDGSKVVTWIVSEKKWNVVSHLGKNKQIGIITCLSSERSDWI